ncbi:Molybdate-transporting ATPase [Thalassotalea sp. ND16A]|nr:Molybdate-transporting ATPase [Thalassotalea sp. ND16A]
MRRLLSELALELAQGECIALMGDSGCGKTTLLNLIAGLEPMQQGKIQVAGFSFNGASEAQLSKLRKQHLGIIFQQFNLLSSLTVRDNIEFSARLANRFDANLCLRLATELGIKPLFDRLPATLSGGEMQRVAIARALAARPKLLLADEPTGDLDDNNSIKVVTQLLRLANFQQVGLLLVTHSKRVARRMDKIYRLSEGKLTLLTDESD